MIRIVGDINFADGFFDQGFGIGSNIAKGQNPFEKLKRSEEDFWIGNCECVISDVSNKVRTSAKEFRISPSVLESIEHFNLYSIANNHVMQHGVEAYLNCLDYFTSKNISFVGTNANRHFCFKHQNTEVGVISFSLRDEKFVSREEIQYWYQPDLIEIENELSLISHCDFKIAYIHWGNEFMNKPYVDQKKLAHWLIDIGFDLIIGLHPHVIQGVEIYKNKYIFYSIGNFLFNMPTIETKIGLIVNVSFDELKKPSIAWDYSFVKPSYEIIILEESKVPKHIQVPSLNRFLQVEEENEIYYTKVLRNIKSFRMQNHLYFMRNINRYSWIDLFSAIIGYMKRRI